MQNGNQKNKQMSPEPEPELTSEKHQCYDQKQLIKQQAQQIEHLLDQQIMQQQCNMSMTGSSIDNIDSEYLKKYKNYMNIIGEGQFNQKKLKKFKIQLKNILNQNGFTFLKSEDFPFRQMKVLNINRGYSYQVIQLEFQVGNISKTIKIYNSPHGSPFHEQKCFASGSFGKTYSWNQFQNQRIIKCIPFKEYLKHMRDDQDLSKIKQVLKQILKQYIFCQICSVLKIGPKLLKPLGFDLVVTEQCAQFCMERCESIQDVQVNDELYNELKTNLLKLHVLNIVHNDIKPDNIMYSPNYQKIVLIDFGLAECLKQKIGHKTFTKFIGTYQFCCTQMQRMLLSNSRQQIDLYYNDAYCLNRALNMFQNQKKQKCFLNVKISESVNSQSYQIQEDTQKQKIFTDNLNIILLKYSLFTEELDLAYKFAQTLNLKNNKLLQQQIVQFLYSLNFSDCLKSFYYEALSKEIKQNKKYIFLKQKILKTNCFSVQSKKHLQNSPQYYRNLYQGIEYDCMSGSKKIEILKFYQIQRKLLNKNDNSKIQQKKQSQKQQSQNNMMKNQQIQNHYSYLISYLNFFNRSWQISFQHKLKVAEEFLIKNSYQSQYDFSTKTKGVVITPKNTFQPLLNVYSFLINYCIQEPFNEWKKQNFIQIIIQSIILGRKFCTTKLNQWLYEIVNKISLFEDKIIFIFKFQYIHAVDYDRSFKKQFLKCNFKRIFNNYNNNNNNKIKEQQEQQLIKKHQIIKQKMSKFKDSTFYISLETYLQENLQTIIQRRNQQKNVQNSNDVEQDGHHQSAQEYKKLLNIMKIVLFNKNDEDLDFIQSQIAQLKKKTQINRNPKFLQLMSLVVVQCIKKYRYLNKKVDKQLQLIQFISRVKNTAAQQSNQIYEINFIHFQMVISYFNRRDFRKLRLLLEYFDKTINFSQISEDFFILKRLNLYFTCKELKKFKNIIKKVLLLPPNSNKVTNLDNCITQRKFSVRPQDVLQACSSIYFNFDVFRNFTIVYYNMLYTTKHQNENSQMFFSRFSEKIQQKTDDIISFLSQHEELYFQNSHQIEKSKQKYEEFYCEKHALYYCQILCYTISFGKYLSSSHIINLNLQKYLELLQKLYRKSKLKLVENRYKQIRQTYINTMMKYFIKQFKHKEAVNLYQGEGQKLQIKQIKNDNEMESLWWYISANFLYKKQYKGMEIVLKIYQYYKQSHSIQKLFLNQMMQDTIIRQLFLKDQLQYTFDFFMTFSKYVYEHVSMWNIKIFYNKVSTFFFIFYSLASTKMLSLIKFCVQNLPNIKCWNNPHMCIFTLFSLSTYLMIQDKLNTEDKILQSNQEIIDYFYLILKHAVKCFQFMTAGGRRVILHLFYKIVMIINDNDAKKSYYYNKKYYKWTNYLYKLETLMRNKCLFYGTNKMMPGTNKMMSFAKQNVPELIFSKAKRKLQIYHDNIQNLYRINYVKIKGQEFLQF